MMHQLSDKRLKSDARSRLRLDTVSFGWGR